MVAGFILVPPVRTMWVARFVQVGLVRTVASPGIRWVRLVGPGAS